MSDQTIARTWTRSQVKALKLEFTEGRLLSGLAVIRVANGDNVPLAQEINEALDAFAALLAERDRPTPTAELRKWIQERIDERPAPYPEPLVAAEARIERGSFIQVMCELDRLCALASVPAAPPASC